VRVTPGGEEALGEAGLGTGAGAARGDADGQWLGLAADGAAGAEVAHGPDEAHRLHALPVAGEGGIAGEVDHAVGVGDEGGVAAPVRAVVLGEVGGDLHRAAGCESGGGDAARHVDHGILGFDQQRCGHFGLPGGAICPLAGLNMQVGVACGELRLYFGNP
jgi:hypothetical protein